MRREVLTVLLSTLLLVNARAENKANQAKANDSKPSAATSPSVSASDAIGRLPVKRVVLYKNGVGYFEHMARVRGSQDLNIDFTTAQLNDVLKSLTALDMGEGRITNIRYNSIAPLDERLKGLRLPFGEQITQAEFLTAVRGARVEVRSGAGALTGKLLSVETEKRVSDKGESYDVTKFSVITDAGEMRSFDLLPGTSVKLADRDLNDEIDKYLGLIGSSRAHDLRRMTLSASGAGERTVFVSYISEVPIWKSTYRIILPTKPGDKALLQGWAIVDNTIGEDWKEVQLSLIAGAPQSFIQQISQPYYVRRPVVRLPSFLMLTPQEHEGTLVGSGSGGGVGVGHAEGIAGGVLSAEPGVSRRIGSASETVEVTGASPLLQTEDANISTNFAAQEQKLEAETVVAEAKDIGDYFEYNLAQKITIGKNQSALVPILQARVDAEKVSIWNENSREIRRALWLTNSSGLTLDSGTFNVLDANAFAGEGLIEAVHPDERRLISFAGDPALRVTMDEFGGGQPYTRIQIYKGIMYLTREEREHRKYTLHNADNMPRQVVIEHPARSGWGLVPGPKPEETTETFMRFRVSVGAGQTENMEIEERRPQVSTVELTTLDSQQVTLITQQRKISPEMLDAFHRVLDQKSKISDISADISRRQKEVDAITRDQSRLRENMKSLKGSAEEKALTERYVKQLDSQEDRLGVLNREIADLQQKHTAAEQELDQIIRQLNFNESF
jgi:hypothetical protein